MKNKRSSEVFGVIEGVHSRTQYMGKGGGLRKCKGGCGRVQRKNGCRSKKTREVK